MFDSILNHKVWLIILCFCTSIFASCSNLDTDYYENGSLKTVSETYMGQRHGGTSVYYENGNIKTYAMYKQGLPHGDTIAYYLNGRKEFEGKYTEGMADGLSIVYFENGMPHVIKNHKNGVLHGQFVKYWPNTDVVFMKGQYMNGKVVDTLEIYHDNGIKVRECYFTRNGENIGCKDF